MSGEIIFENLSRLSRLIFLVQFGAVLMRHRGHNGHNGQFSHSLVYCMDAVIRSGHKEQLTLNH